MTLHLVKDGNAKAVDIAIAACPNSIRLGLLSVATDDGEITIEIDQRIALKLIDQLLTFMGSPPFDE